MHWFFTCESERRSLETIKIGDEIFQKYCKKHFLTLSKILKPSYTIQSYYYISFLSYSFSFMSNYIC